MSAVQILHQDFQAAMGLAFLLALRRIDVRNVQAGGETERCAVLVLSAQHEATLGGMRAVTDMARKSGATSVVIVAEDSVNFRSVEELGGRLVRVALPAMATHHAPLRQPDLLVLADLVGGMISPMVAGDAMTGTLIDMARRVARSDVTVFVNGPTGSGKEVMSRFIHAASSRAAQPFVAINCAAIPDTMLEATLFGHEKGAFTGASTSNRGLIRAAEGGTLLLDEISEMPLALQAKLLRVLQERMLTPVGGQGEVAVNVRIIATSNRNMLAEVRNGRFREDLYYRLNVFPLTTRPLADRRGDIAPIASALLRRHASGGQAVPMMTADTLAVLERHDWAGNVRELENVIQRALVLCDGVTILPEDILLDVTDTVAPARLRQVI